MTYFRTLNFLLNKRNLPNKNIYYAFVNNQEVGPLSEVELKTLIKNQTISEDTLIWIPSMKQWEKASNIPVVNKWLLLYTQNNKTHKTAKSTLHNDIVAAMAKLGYKGKVVENIVDDILMSNSSISISDAIRLALSRLMK